MVNEKSWEEYLKLISELIEDANDELMPKHFEMLIEEIMYELNTYSH